MILMIKLMFAGYLQVCSEYLLRKCLGTGQNYWLWMRRISLLIFPPSSQDCLHAEILCKSGYAYLYILPPPAPRCNRIDPQYEPDTPQAMIALDMWLPPSQEVDSWGLLDAGQLGPAVRYNNHTRYFSKLFPYRFGFLSPNASQTEPLQGWNHWKVFKRREILNKLILTDKQLQFVTEHTVDENEK